MTSRTRRASAQILSEAQAEPPGLWTRSTTAFTEELVRAAARGETLLKPEIMRRVLSQANAPKATSSEPTNLTERELEVLEAVARGERSKEIAVQLGISERTVKAHLASIYSKLGVDSRAAAIAVAAQRGLLKGQ